MINLALRQADHLATHDVQPPAKVNLLAMGKETTVEATNTPVVFRAYEQTGTRCPQHFCNIVILPAVGFNSIEESAATERIAIAVEIATRSVSS